METFYNYDLETPSGYIFKSVYFIRSTYDNIPITGTLYVGNPKTGNLNEACTTISVSYPESLRAYDLSNDRPPPIDITVASLILTKYYEACTETMKLPKGKGTREMIVSALSLIKQLCPFVKEFDLNDASSKECDNGTPISLPYFYITQKWKTWYEGVFNAYLKPATLYTNYHQALDNLKQTRLGSFDVFSANYLFGQTLKVKEVIRSAYEQSTTLENFFAILYTSQSVTMTCILIQPWIDKFMRDMRIDVYILYQKWYIHVESIPTYSFYNKRRSFTIKRRKNTGIHKKGSIWL